MRRNTGLRGLALVVALVGAACGDDSDGTGPAEARPLPQPGPILYQTPDEGGDVAPGLEVIEPTGGDPRTIPADRLQGGVATSAPARAIYAAVDGTFLLVDAEAGEATPIDIPDEVAAGLDPTYVNSSIQGGGRRFFLLTGPLGGTVVLVDLDSGTTTDLGPVLDDAEFVAAAEFDLDEELVVVETDRGLWLVPTESPADARLVDEGTFGGDLADDGRRLVYTRASDPSRPQIVVLDLENEETTTVATGADVRFAGFLGDQILVEREASAELVDPESGDQTPVLEEGTADVRPIRAGNRAVVGVGQTGAGRWFLVDDDGEATELEELAGLIPRITAPTSRWVPFIDAAAAARTVHVLDIEDGEVTEVVALEDGGSRLIEGPSASPDGRYAVLRTRSGEEEETLLADFEEGTLTVVGTNVVGASFAPDGSSLVLSRLTDPDTGAADLAVVPVDDPNQEGEIIGAGLFPLWVPAPS